MVAGTHSGVGKTTVATGLMAALRRRNVAVAGAKVGPDFIDPGYHQLATGRPSRNLDAFLSGPEAIGPLAGRAAEGADVLVIEGVMGLFDGVGATMESSTAEVAALLEAPVLLVVDGSKMSGSIGALVHGYHDYLERLRGRGVDAVVVNRVGSEVHREVLREALQPLGIGVLGLLGRHDDPPWRDRHLGLVPVVEAPAPVAASLEALAARLESEIDLEAVMALAASARRVRVNSPPAASPQGGPVPVAVASGAAFSFAYPDNLERLEEAGAELLPFDPRRDEVLPAGAQALYAGGGFPEVFAEELSANEPLRRAVAEAVTGGLPTWAECGGLVWLCRSLDGRPLCGALEAKATMGSSVHVGYRQATVTVDNPVAAAGTELVGHEHRYSATDPEGQALELAGRAGRSRGGFASPTLLASYLHLHLGAHPSPAERFVATAARRLEAGR